jgi:hypothetical protein
MHRRYSDMKKYFIIISLLTLLIIFISRDGSSQPPTGEYVIVQFRRDALGSANARPISPTTGSNNGARVFLGGKLLTVNEEWIVLEHEKQEHWIPKDVVLLIAVTQ